ncbi:MAG TPA: hypothetical protein VJK52_04835, partial [Candidatus Nanoarchaeia archaeon]|nr:hypothetical protein [Candidatus Nanoarchaeia archaeon]
MRQHNSRLILGVVAFVVIALLLKSGTITGQASKIKSHCCINTQTGLHSMYGVAKACPAGNIDRGRIPGSQCAMEAAKYRKAPGTQMAVSPTPTQPMPPPQAPVQAASPNPSCADTDYG